MIVVALVIRPGARLLLALVAAQLLWGIVAVRLVLPNVADRATAAELDPAVVLGPLVSDVECRIDHPASSDPIADHASDQAAFDAYNCAKRWAYADSDEGVPWKRAALVTGITLAIVAGVVFRFWTTSHLWLDEAISVNIARLPLGDLPSALRADGHPPLYYGLLHGGWRCGVTATSPCGPWPGCSRCWRCRWRGCSGAASVARRRHGR